ncbi:MAG: RusA family crossover junction endodeoxyribonuclease [Nocardioidaceae bacterium]
MSAETTPASTWGEAGELAVVVHGTPAPQGSKTARPIYRGRDAGRVFTGRVAQQESSGAVKPWRQAVKWAALEATDHAGALEGALEGPLHVTVTFTVARPKGHWRTGRNAGRLRDAAPMRPAVKPDLDKLVRSTLDGLGEAGVWTDDAQVVELTALKLYPSPGVDAVPLPSAIDTLPIPGAVIRVREVTQ